MDFGTARLMEFNVRAIFKVIELSFFGSKKAAKSWIQSIPQLTLS